MFTNQLYDLITTKMVRKLRGSVIILYIQVCLVGLAFTFDQWSGRVPRLSSLVDFDTLDYVISLHNKPHVTRWKCLGPLGCFHNGPPFYHPKIRPISLLPYDRDRLSVKCLYYSRNNTGLSQLLQWDKPQSLITSFFDPNLDTKIILHGLFDMLRVAPWILDMKNELLLHGPYNVIVVDWTKGNRFPYEQAVANTRAVAVEIALVIKGLIKHRGLRLDSVHIIGHSLGAHLGGYIGALIPGIGRISGLDPAGVYYQGTDIEVRLDPTDALFVDVIHTDASTFSPIGIGTVDFSGHVDFFPNGGIQQPGCLDDFRAETFLLLGLLPGSRDTVSCDHERSYLFYLESINNPFCQMIGVYCDNYDDFEDGKCGDCGSEGQNCLKMGYHTVPNWNSTQPKAYFLKTASKEPFCVYQYHVILDLKPNSDKSIGKGFLIFQSDSDEADVKIQLSRKVHKISPGHTYAYLISSKINLGPYNTVVFTWKSYQYSHSRLLLDKITISSIQVDKRQLRSFCQRDSRNEHVLKEGLC